MSQQNDFINNYRESVINWSRPKKIAGIYLAKDVDRSVESMQSAFANMQDAYQDRFEEQRLSLLSVSRERDELATTNDKLSILNSELTAEIDSVDDLRRQASALAAENEKLRAAAELYEEQKQAAEQLKQEVRELTAANEKLKSESRAAIEKLQSESRSAIEKLQVELENADYKHREELAAADSKMNELRAELQLKNEKIDQLQAHINAEVDDKALQIKNRNEQIRLMRDRYQMAMHDHVDALRNMSEAYKRHAESIFDLDNSAIERFMN